MELGKVKKIHECPRPQPITLPAPKPAEQPIPATNWPVRQPERVAK